MQRKSGDKAIGMLFTGKSFVSSDCFRSHLLLKRNGRKFRTTLAKKRDSSGSSKTNRGPIFPLKVSKSVLAQSAAAVIALGFIDAGYSGDWSRIGVISKETEDLLKAAAFVVVPLSLVLIFSFPKELNS